MPTVKKFQKLVVKNRQPGTLSVGGNTLISLDGILLSVSYLKLEFKPKNVTRVTMDLFVDVEIEQDIVLQQDSQTTINKGTPREYVLGRYTSVGLDKKS